MPARIINLDINSNIINFTAGYILKVGGKIAVVSGGRRPFLFIKRKLVQEQGKSFFSPYFYTNDEFVEHFVFEYLKLVKIPDIEAAYIIYEIVKNETPSLLRGDKTFASFIEWAQEIFSFIEQLDLEDVSEENLKGIKANAEIGYDVPKKINELLINIFKIRRIFHEKLDKSLKTTKGYSFLKISESECFDVIDKFDEIVFMSPFYLHKTEIKILKKIEKLTLITQGSPKEYSVLDSLYKEFGEAIPNNDLLKSNYELNIYSAIDDQSQGCVLKNLIRSYCQKELDKTVVVIADPKMLQSVVSEISIITDNYNVSAGYPAEKTAVFSLIDEIIEAQISRKGQYYHSKDIVRVLTNPLFKNVRFLGQSAISRIIAHKIEEALNPDSRKHLSGKMFVSFKEIVEEKELLSDIEKNVLGAWAYVPLEKIIKILNEIFENFFQVWEKIEIFNDLSSVLFNFLNKIYVMSAVGSYPLNIEAMDILLSLSKELKHGEVSKVKFKNEEIFMIFKKIIKNKRIALPGSPLKGLQILGLLESRNLSFENVFVVGMKDSAIPAIKRDSSLIPKDIMYALGIEMTHKEYEIQRYHFNRLIAGAKKVNLIYPDNDKDERSRFIESLIWEKQLKENNLDVVKINKFVLPISSVKKTTKRSYLKTKKIKEYLSNMSYSYSKIDTYLMCKLKFYFKYVLSLDDEAEIGDDLSGKDIGNFIHDFFKDVFHENVSLKEILADSFEKDFLKKLNDKFSSAASFSFREDAFLIREVFNRRMKRVLERERERTFERVYACEKEYNSKIQTTSGGVYKLNCRIDRIDTSGKGYIIFDYKTGNVSKNIIHMRYFEKLSFSRQSIKKAIESLQLPLYKYIFEKETGMKVLECGLYAVKKVEIINFPIEQDIYEKCIDVIKFLLDDINSDDCFAFDEEDETKCKTCKYFYVCR